MAYPKPQLMREGESRREAARRAASGQIGTDRLVGMYGHGKEIREAQRNKPEPEPADIHEARVDAARRAASGSLEMPRALRQFKDAQDLAASGNVAEAVKFVDDEEALDEIEAACMSRRVDMALDHARAMLEQADETEGE